MEINSKFWQGRNVFLTGHTGFKGGWLAIWLESMGANVTGFSLPPESQPNLYSDILLEKRITKNIFGDLRNTQLIKDSISQAKPSVVFHLAAKAVLLDSYVNPIETYDTNVMGTVKLLDACRDIDSIEAIVVITSDKCYKEHESNYAFKESDPLGGFDPYSSSKACTEIVTSAFGTSFFSNTNVKIGTARSGNVFGGGDWANKRLIPDIVRAINSSKKVIVRSLQSVRPWQHVLEPLSGYIRLAEYLVNNRIASNEAWNFGPKVQDIKDVKWILEYIGNIYSELTWDETKITENHESNFLLLDSAKANLKLDWKPNWTLEESLDKTLSWYDSWWHNQNMLNFTLDQIMEYQYGV